jgi:hypothetical protein
MVDFDVNADTTPKLPFPNVTHTSPTIAALKSAISGSAVAAKYPTRVLQAVTKNDLIYICRVENITVAGI